MLPRSLTPLAALALAATFPPSAAAAAEQRCSAVSIEADADVRQRFGDLLPALRSELQSLGVETCARVTLHGQALTGIGVTVTLPDGRSAARDVERREDLAPTLQALLLVPQPAPSGTPPPAAGPPLHPRPARPAQHAPRSDRDASPDEPRERELGIELSVIGGARVGDGQFGYGAGVLAFAEVRHWLMGFQGRADGYRPIGGGDPETALELGLLAGHRFDFARGALDLSIGPAMVMKGVAFSETQSVTVESKNPMVAPAVPPPHAEPSTGPLPRLLLAARWGFSPRSTFRTFVGLDGEVGPTHADLAPNVTSPRMPAFSVGLALGATVGTR